MDDESKQLMNENLSHSTIDDDAPPPDNGPCYISCCNWCGTMYQRFDTSYVNFFCVMNVNHGLWIMVKLAVMAYYKDRLKLNPGEV